MTYDAKASKKYYEKNKPARLALAKARKDAVASYVRTIKEDNPCSDCGVFYPYYVMQFDHVRGKKETEISTAMVKGWSIRRIQTEIDKCDLVCCNCHCIRTWGGER